MRFRYVLVVSVLLAGCASAPQTDWNNPAETSRQVSQKYDPFTKSTTFSGPFYYYAKPSSVSISAYRGASTKDLEYTIYVFEKYLDDWRFYEFANDSAGNSLKAKVIDREVGSCGGRTCWKDESLAVSVKREYLEANKASGLTLKVWGRRGESIVKIPAGYISGFLSEVPNN